MFHLIAKNLKVKWQEMPCTCLCTYARSVDCFNICCLVYYISWGSVYMLFSCLIDFFLFLYLLCQVVCGALVLQQWVGLELLRWETWIQDVGPQENSWPHGILTRESSSKGLIPTLRPGYTQQPESSSAGHLMPNN